MSLMFWLLIATGSTGTLTLIFLLRTLRHVITKQPSYSMHFSPKGGCTHAIVEELGRAKSEILVQAYSFTSDPIGKALIEAKQRGVAVELVIDASQEKDAYSDLPALIEHGLVTRVDAKHAIAHNKIMIIDRRTVITGSFNFTNQAEDNNAENVIVMRNYLDVAEAYRHNFFAHHEHSRAADIKVKPSEQKGTRPAVAA